MFLYLGKSTLKLKRYSDAMDYFNLSLLKNQKESLAWAGLGEVHSAKADWTDAIQAYTKAQKLTPENIEIATNFGIVLLKSGRYQEALTKLKFATNGRDNPGLILFYLGITYMKTGDNKQAIKTFKKFVNTWDGDKQYIEKANNFINKLQ
jgi:tetratricopeptide (TPR) repeat protein